METIASFNNPIEAEMACEFLRAEGFAADLTNLAAQSAVLGAYNPLSVLELKVPPAEAEEAARCLHGWRTAAAPDEPIEPAPPAPRYVGYDATDWNPRERLVERAYRCSVLGPLLPVPFVSWYGLYCLVLAARRPEPLRYELRRKLRISAVVGGALSFCWLVLTVVVYARWLP